MLLQGLSLSVSHQPILIPFFFPISLQIIDKNVDSVLGLAELAPSSLLSDGFPPTALSATCYSGGS